MLFSDLYSIVVNQVEGVRHVRPTAVFLFGSVFPLNTEVSITHKELHLGAIFCHREC